MIESGTILQGRFLIEERIGEGGMGAVYTAVDQKFGSRVAIKETFFGDAELAEAFEREARLLNASHHPILPHVSDHFSENGGHFLVMEYIEGEDMSELLKRGEVFAVDDVMRWTLDLLDGLDYLHSQDPPIIHRDIKPNNLKLTSRDNIVLLDFGMAKETSGNTLGMRSVFGYSRRYSPLEQIEGTGTDVRSDIFSLGATVFHLLTGKPPVDAIARASAIVTGRPDPLQPANFFRAEVPEPVAAIIHSTLALNPEQRFITARAMWNALEYALGLNREKDSAAEAVHKPNETVPPVVIPAGAEFPALEAFKAELEETPSEPEAVSGFDAAGTIDQPRDKDENALLDRAVIHLGTVDLEDDLPDVPAATESIEPVGDEARPTTAASSFPPNIPPPRRVSKAAIWLPILILGAVLGVYGLMGGFDETLVQERVIGPETGDQDDETANRVSPEVSEDAVLPDAELSGSDSDEAAPALDRSIAAVPPKSEPERMAEETREPVSTKGVRRPERGERSANEDRAEKPGPSRVRDTPARTSRPSSRQTRGQRSGAERPRIVPPRDEPRVVSIETIFTGIPYERRRRWEEEEFRRWRMRERRRNNRRAYPPF